MEIKSESRWWDLPAASLLLVLMITAATRLVATRWTDNLGTFQTLAFFGTIAGLALGQSRFSSRVSALFATAYGLFAIPWLLGRISPEQMTWPQRLNSLVTRLEIIIRQLLNQEVVQDSLLFLVLISILYWVLTAHAGYTLTRYGQAWPALLPMGVALFAIHSFDALVARRAWYLAVYLFFGLVLVARVAFLHHHNRWQKSRTALPPHLGLDFIRFTLLASALLIFFAWTVPALASSVPAAEKAFQRIKQPWNEMRDRMDNAFASLRSSVGQVSDYYGSSVLLGRGNKLTDRQVFTVTTPADAPESIRYYWRARVYDTYKDGQWLSTTSRQRYFNPEEQVILPNEQGRWLGTFQITSAVPVATLYFPSQPLWTSHTATVEMATNPDGSLDYSAFRAQPAIVAGETYQVQASLSKVSVAELREAGTAYPEWVKDRYLEVPSSITDRTIRLAQVMTADLQTPYDKAMAITNYLRENIEYSETIPEVPARQDSIDWFLFDLKQGFCNYYASAEVIMLRSLGIPARWALGFAQGERTEDGTYIVRQKELHSWPEVYFPGYGWVEFEPTASQPSIARPVDQNASELSAGTGGLSEEELLRQQQEELRALRDNAEPLSADGSPTGAGSSKSKNMFWASAVLFATLAIYIVWVIRRRINPSPVPVLIERTMIRIGMHPPEKLRLWARRAGLPPLSRSYMEINYALNRLGKRPAEADTPKERAESLALTLPPAHDSTTQLIREYLVGMFSPEPANLTTAQTAGTQIRKLSYLAWFKRLFARLQRPPVPPVPGLKQ